MECLDDARSRSPATKRPHTHQGNGCTNSGNREEEEYVSDYTSRTCPSSCLETCNILFDVYNCRYRGCRRHSGCKKSHCSNYFVCPGLKGNARRASRHLPADCESSNEI